MPSLSIIKDLYIIKDTDPCLFAGLIVFQEDMLGFKRMKEAFHSRIIVAIAGTTHAGSYTASFQQIPEFAACILASLVRVMD